MPNFLELLTTHKSKESIVCNTYWGCITTKIVRHSLGLRSLNRMWEICPWRWPLPAVGSAQQSSLALMPSTESMHTIPMVFGMTCGTGGIWYLVYPMQGLAKPLRMAFGVWSLVLPKWLPGPSEPKSLVRPAGNRTHNILGPFHTIHHAPT